MVRTGFGAEIPAPPRAVHPLKRPFGKSPAEGAATSTHLASSPGLERVTGCSFADGKRKRSSGRTYDEATAERLWRVSAGLVGLASIA